MSFANLFHIAIDPRRVYGLDILRAFAILFVMLGHGEVFMPPAYGQINELFVFDGVSIFFVLSGFLIGGILVKTLDTQPANWRTLANFWLKRWFRTVPPYLFVLVLVILFALQDPGFAVGSMKRFFIFSQNFRSPHPFFFMEAWSLSIEEWFYLLVPSAIFAGIAVGVRPKYAVPLVAAGLLVLVTVYRYYKYLHLPPHNLVTWDQEYRKIVVTRLDSLMYGVLAAYFSYYVRESWSKYKTLKFYLGLALLVTAKYILPMDFGVYMCVFYFSLNSLAVMLMLPFFSNLKTGSGLLYRAITSFSLISYSVYLLNYSIVSLRLVPMLTHRYALGYACFWFITLTLSVLMYNYLELPFMRLRNQAMISKAKT